MKPGASAALAVFGIVIGVVGALLIGAIAVIFVAVFFGASILALDSEVDTRLSRVEATLFPDSIRTCPGCGLVLKGAESSCPRCGRRLGPPAP